MHGGLTRAHDEVYISRANYRLIYSSSEAKLATAVSKYVLCVLAHTASVFYSKTCLNRGRLDKHERLWQSVLKLLGAVLVE